MADELFEPFEVIEERLDDCDNDEDIYDGQFQMMDDDSKDNEDVGIALIIKTEDGHYKCSECPYTKTFSSFKRFLTHMKSHNTLNDEDIKALEAHVLDKSVKNKELCEEIKSPDGTVLFRCKVCNAEFDSRKRILLHVPMHRNSEAAISRSSHMPSQSQYSCLLCNKTFEEKYEHEMHMAAHKENKTLELVKKTDKATPKSKGSHKCQYCEKEFNRPHEKVKHERVHTNEKPYACDICGKKFRVTYCLSLHKRNVHSDERPYVCTFPGCNKRFKAQGVYNHHLNTHGTEKKYKCSFCSKAFKTSVQLAGHKNTHTKPFSCNVCSRTFSSLYSAKNHMATHNRPSDNLKYVCGVCGASYARGYALNDHIKVAHPNEFVCDDVVEEYEIVEEGEDVKNEDETVYAVVLEEN